MAALVQNKKAFRDYTILEKFEAGLVLSGQEVKSLRNGRGELSAAYVVVRGDEAYLVGMAIPPYQPNNTPKEYEPDRTRKLLLSKKEILQLLNEGEKKGLTIVPLSVYNAKHKLKVEIAVVRGKKKFDKRETLKKREADKDIRRSLKREY
jgi:SsrA-binding protein